MVMILTNGIREPWLGMISSKISLKIDLIESILPRDFILMLDPVDL